MKNRRSLTERFILSYGAGGDRLIKSGKKSYMLESSIAPHFSLYRGPPIDSNADSLLVIDVFDAT